MDDRVNYLDLYDQEYYLFDVVRNRFSQQGYLSAFDFFCIVIFKVNRAKTMIARRLLERCKDADSLDTIVRKLTTEIASEAEPKEKMRRLIKSWGFLLPMASAILTVLYPDEFTVYDSRVCDAIKSCHDLKNKSSFDSLWDGYQEYIENVKDAAPNILSLRDKDRYLWGESFYEQLTEGIARSFGAKVTK